MWVAANSVENAYHTFPHMLFIDQGFGIYYQGGAGQPFVYSIHGWLGPKGAVS